TVIVSENHGYQCIRRLQMWRTGKSFGNEFRHRDAATNRLEGDYLKIDFIANAQSFGVRTWHALTADQLARALREARVERRPCVIVAEVEKHRVLPGGGCWWDVAPAEVSKDEKTRELRAQYERDKAQFQRLHY